MDFPPSLRRTDGASWWWWWKIKLSFFGVWTTARLSERGEKSVKNRAGQKKPPLILLPALGFIKKDGRTSLIWSAARGEKKSFFIISAPPHINLDRVTRWPILAPEVVNLAAIWSLCSQPHRLRPDPLHSSADDSLACELYSFIAYKKRQLRFAPGSRLLFFSSRQIWKIYLFLSFRGGEARLKGKNKSGLRWMWTHSPPSSLSPLAS